MVGKRERVSGLVWFGLVRLRLPAKRKEWKKALRLAYRLGLVSSGISSFRKMKKMRMKQKTRLLTIFILLFAHSYYISSNDYSLTCVEVTSVA